MTAQDGEEFFLHAARHEVVVALVRGRFPVTGCFTGAEDLFETLRRSVGHTPLVIKGQ